jgi:hypothetical protein
MKVPEGNVFNAGMLSYEIPKPFRLLEHHIVKPLHPNGVRWMVHENEDTSTGRLAQPLGKPRQPFMTENAGIWPVIVKRIEKDETNPAEVLDGLNPAAGANTDVREYLPKGGPVIVIPQHETVRHQERFQMVRQSPIRSEVTAIRQISRNDAQIGVRIGLVDRANDFTQSLRGIHANDQLAFRNDVNIGDVYDLHHAITTSF